MSRRGVDTGWFSRVSSKMRPADASARWTDSSSNAIELRRYGDVVLMLYVSTRGRGYSSRKRMRIIATRDDAIEWLNEEVFMLWRAARVGASGNIKWLPTKLTNTSRGMTVAPIGDERA